MNHMKILYNKSQLNQVPPQKKPFKQGKIKKFNTFAGVHFGHGQVISSLRTHSFNILGLLVKYAVLYMGKDIKPKQQTIGDRVGLTRETVNRKIVELKELGLLDTEARYFKNKRIANKYKLAFNLYDFKVTDELSEIFPILKMAFFKLLSRVYLNKSQRYINNDPFCDFEGRDAEELKYFEFLTKTGCLSCRKINHFHKKRAWRCEEGHEQNTFISKLH